MQFFSESVHVAAEGYGLKRIDVETNDEPSINIIGCPGGGELRGLTVDEASKLCAALLRAAAWCEAHDLTGEIEVEIEDDENV